MSQGLPTLRSMYKTRQPIQEYELVVAFQIGTKAQCASKKRNKIEDCCSNLMNLMANN